MAAIPGAHVQLKSRNDEKLDKPKVRWIMRESCKETLGSTISRNVGIFAWCVQKLCRLYAGIPIDATSYPRNLSRPKKRWSGHREHSAVLSAVSEECSGAVFWENVIGRTAGVHIQHSAIHAILRDVGAAQWYKKYIFWIHCSRTLEILPATKSPYLDPAWHMLRTPIQTQNSRVDGCRPHNAPCIQHIKR